MEKIPLEQSNNRVKIHRFDQVWRSTVRIIISKYISPPEITEIGIYLEPREYFAVKIIRNIVCSLLFSGLPRVAFPYCKSDGQ
jgi:hypothetical protein